MTVRCKASARGNGGQKPDPIARALLKRDGEQNFWTRIRLNGNLLLETAANASQQAPKVIALCPTTPHIHVTRVTDPRKIGLPNATLLC